MATITLPKIAQGHLRKDLDLTTDELFSLLDLASDVKHSPLRYRSALAGKSIALLFEKPSLRTRMTFELAIQQLGGFALLNEGRIGMREPLKDMARNLDRWVDGIVARTFLQKTVDDLARWSACRDQRSQRQVSSLPGDCRYADHPRAFRRHPRAETGVRGRWQQCGAIR